MSTVVLSGCGNEIPDKNDVKPISWYVEHPEIRKEMIKKCRDNPGEKNPNCTNAIFADYEDYKGPDTEK
ncbi:hypothetical protein B9G39_26005 [Zooshikella ganghwensis]|uniref:Entry exclusion protein n=1 Tax=Zooshikella ganghwensis TaxID=202772 RepID=A0A4P9VIA2_9GAMM|nr:hypothetical protein B9G39_26005 [Zooshikella ganghwensis]